jgi:hypothetical protein
MEEFPELLDDSLDAASSSSGGHLSLREAAAQNLLRLKVLNGIKTTRSMVNRLKVDVTNERVVAFHDRPLGIRLSTDIAGRAVVDLLLADLAPAAASVIKVGDVVSSVNGQPVVGVSAVEVSMSIASLPRPVNVGFSELVPRSAATSPLTLKATQVEDAKGGQDEASDDDDYEEQRDRQKLQEQLEQQQQQQQQPQQPPQQQQPLQPLLPQQRRRSSGQTRAGSIIKSPSKQALLVKFTRRPLGISIKRSVNRFATAEVDAADAAALEAQFPNSSTAILPCKGDLLLSVDNHDVRELDITEIAALIGRAFLPFVIKFKRPSNLATVELRDSFSVMAE